MCVTPQMRSIDSGPVGADLATLTGNGQRLLKLKSAVTFPKVKSVTLDPNTR